MSWISVKDKLPHTHTVLGWITNRPSSPSFVSNQPFADTVCFFLKHDPQRVFTENDRLIPEEGEWRINGSDEDGDRGVVIVTHWQELPEPPEI